MHDRAMHVACQAFETSDVGSERMRKCRVGIGGLGRNVLQIVFGDDQLSDQSRPGVDAGRIDTDDARDVIVGFAVDSRPRYGGGRFGIAPVSAGRLLDRATPASATPQSVFR